MPRGDFFPEDHWVSHYEKGKYDVALLHLDQQMLDEGIWQEGKASLFRELNEVITDIPKIVIMHGTPYEVEMTPNSDDFITKFKEIIGDCWVIFNSHKAKQQWCHGMDGKTDGFDENKAFVIWHGLDPDEWWDLPKEPRVVTMIGPAGLPTYYDRPFLSAIREELSYKNIRHCHITVDWSARDWDGYREFLGRSLLYLNPTKESPMPRARTEAMLSGCCVLTTPHQDADQFIEDGKNGFLIPRKPDKVVELIEDLIYDYKKALKIGQEGKKTALRTFHVDRYQSQWASVLYEVTKNEILKKYAEN